MSPTLRALQTRFRPLDALVNNAGIAIFKPILDVTYEDWSPVMAVNLTGPFLCAQAAAPIAQAKRGLAHPTQQQAIEFASLGIRGNAAAPGPVNTAMAKDVRTLEIRGAYHDAIPLNRYGLEQEIAEAIFLLCSDPATWVASNSRALSVLAY